MNKQNVNEPTLYEYLVIDNDSYSPTIMGLMQGFKALAGTTDLDLIYLWVEKDGNRELFINKVKLYANVNIEFIYDPNLSSKKLKSHALQIYDSETQKFVIYGFLNEGTDVGIKEAQQILETPAPVQIPIQINAPTTNPPMSTIKSPIMTSPPPTISLVIQPTSLVPKLPLPSETKYQLNSPLSSPVEPTESKKEVTVDNTTKVENKSNIGVIIGIIGLALLGTFIALERK